MEEETKIQRSQNTATFSPTTPNIPYPHSRMAAGQEAELGHVQPLSRYTQAIKSMLQTYHQGPPDWGQICRVPCEESKGDMCEVGVNSCKPQASQPFTVYNSPSSPPPASPCLYSPSLFPLSYFLFFRIRALPPPLPRLARLKRRSFQIP